MINRSESTRFLTIANLTKIYLEGNNRLTVLEEASLQVSAGQFVVLLGRSGSGKSTLLHLIAGIDTPTSGLIQVNDQKLTELSEKERTLFRRKHIGFIFQFFNLIPTLTVRENLALPLELNAGSAVDPASAIGNLLEHLQLADRMDSFPDRLSGGEQQRVAIARALIHQPALVLADEPTGNLDSVTSVLVIDLLEKLVREAGHTLVVATHYESLTAHADRVIAIHEGKIVEHS